MANDDLILREDDKIDNYEEDSAPLSLVCLPLKEGRRPLWAYIMSTGAVGLYDSHQNVWEGVPKQLIDYDEMWFDDSETIEDINVRNILHSQSSHVVAVAKYDNSTFAIKHKESGIIFDWFLYEIESDGQYTEHYIALMPANAYEEYAGKSANSNYTFILNDAEE